MSSPSKQNLSVKQQREARRAEKIAAMKKQQATAKRNQRIGIIAAIVGAVAVLGLVVTFVVTGSTPAPDRDDITVADVQTFDDLTATHIDPTPVDYEAEYGMNPPAGGDHFGAWLNCGVYSEPQQNENAVHSLEHGALWITYDADSMSEADLQTLQDAVPSTYVIISPFDGLPAPVVASGWGVQVELDGVDDPRLEQFVQKYWKAPTVPEPGAACTGAIDGPGRVA